MEKIAHKFVQVNGVKLHVAEIGTESSPTVVFLHGFPEIWYSWRHQMIAVAEAGYRAIAPDCRGYGLSDPPPETEKFGFSDLIDDLLAILDYLGIDKVSIITKDSGTRPGNHFALLHPTRVTSVISLGVPHRPFGDTSYLKEMPEGFYVNRWREPGRAEADFGRLDAKTVVRNIYILFSRSEIPITSGGQQRDDNQLIKVESQDQELLKNGMMVLDDDFFQMIGRMMGDDGFLPKDGKNCGEIMDIVEPSTPLLSWFTEQDLSAYGALYEKSGFLNPLKVPYRSMEEEDNIVDQVIKIPMLLIVGGKDYFLKFPGVEDLIKSEEVKRFSPNLEIEWIPEGSHFVQEQFPDRVNSLILAFLRNHN
ncbi:hypothetical protein OSB04_un001626 [Centaurea solstitialis]|uniref:AB hydrolase-1 domain-containing protein n=1 Tax=Centaurea solstitialis TaxID=347529 RepID=A0AA38S1T0_9ASTR|nr:hypothetical protein OSB04_un001626 [Centaurea solstitialis]